MLTLALTIALGLLIAFAVLVLLSIPEVRAGLGFLVLMAAGFGALFVIGLVQQDHRESARIQAQVKAAQAQVKAAQAVQTTFNRAGSARPVYIPLACNEPTQKCAEEQATRAKRIADLNR